MLVRFGSFQIDDQRFELRHGETLVERLHSFCPLRQDGLGREVQALPATEVSRRKGLLERARRTAESYSLGRLQSMLTA